MTPGAPGPQPTELRLLRASARLEVTFDDGVQASLPAEYLRVESPSAEVQGHGPGQRVIVPGKAGVNIASVEPVGRYAVRIHFTDGHATGIFTWAYLYTLHMEHAERWRTYLGALTVRGLRRDA